MSAFGPDPEAIRAPLLGRMLVRHGHDFRIVAIGSKVITLADPVTDQRHLAWLKDFLPQLRELQAEQAESRGADGDSCKEEEACEGEELAP